ncbi:MAG: ABC transporter substrate-binding protein, partial [Bauldia litoralis]
MNRIIAATGIALATALAVSPAAHGQSTKVIMHLDYLVNGYHAPLYIAHAKGWYREAGLDVTIRPGKGSADSIKSVGTGQAQFGVPDFGASVKAMANGIPITAVAAYLQRVPAGVISFADKAVRKPKDLEGK